MWKRVGGVENGLSNMLTDKTKVNISIGLFVTAMPILNRKLYKKLDFEGTVSEIQGPITIPVVERSLVIFLLNLTSYLMIFKWRTLQTVLNSGPGK